MSVFKDQAEFMQAGEISESSTDKKTQNLAINCVEEEHKEWAEERSYFDDHQENLNDLKEMIDLIYVCAQYMNIAVGHEKAQQLWNIVHQHNMSKCIDGKLLKRGDGKVLKPEGFDKYAWIKQFKEVLKEDKAEEWKTEKDLKLFNYLGYPCAIVRHPFSKHLCGYVNVKPDHPAYTTDYDLVSIQVHGGLTYANKKLPNTYIKKGEGVWLGFDCAHSGDLVPNNPFKHREDVLVYRNMMYVEEEIRSMCEQLEMMKKKGVVRNA